MLPELSRRFRAYQKATRLVDQFARALLSIKSTNSLDHLKSEREGEFFRTRIFLPNHDNFSVYHRGTRADLGVIRQIFVDEDYDISRFKQMNWVLSAYRKILNEGGTPAIIDAGANIGLGGIYLKQQFSNARLISVEPSSINLKVLAKNLSNPADRIVHGAIHAGAKTIDLVDPNEGEWGFSTHASTIKPSAHMETVRCYKFSELIANYETPFILKIDIEGGEKDQFDDHNFFSRFALIIIELHDWLYPGDGTSSSFLKFAADANFDFCHRGENVFLFNRIFTSA